MKFDLPYGRWNVLFIPSHPIQRKRSVEFFMSNVPQLQLPSQLAPYLIVILRRRRRICFTRITTGAGPQSRLQNKALRRQPSASRRMSNKGVQRRFSMKLLRAICDALCAVFSCHGNLLW
ncbi:MAG TPA: hypothetical protein VHY48_06870 [Acidobacteriaceae bacterium]|jgi:hypothetical protein|nr:hypothetical protein [Acidobacteriaceae bacterium]